MTIKFNIVDGVYIGLQADYVYTSNSVLIKAIHRWVCVTGHDVKEGWGVENGDDVIVNCECQ